MNRVQIDVSRNWADDRIPAMLVIESHEKLAPRDALSRFRRSVSQWLANTEEGKRAWEASRQDFNYGDFLQEGVNAHDNFKAILNANGLHNAWVERLEAEDCCTYWDDTIFPEEA